MRAPTPAPLLCRVTLGAALAALACACNESASSSTVAPHASTADADAPAAEALAESAAVPAAVPAAAPATSTPVAPPGHAPFAAQIEQKFKPGEGPRITGTVALDPQFATAAIGHPLLLILRSKEGQGMPIAVLSIDAPHFPVDFDLGPEHAPLQADDTPEILKGENKLVVRVAASGSMMGGPGDIECEPVLVRAGDPPLALTLDRKRAP